jgi:hypothetical protein
MTIHTASPMRASMTDMSLLTTYIGESVVFVQAIGFCNLSALYRRDHIKRIENGQLREAAKKW